MGYATLPILCLTQAQWDARTKPLGSRQLGFNTDTHELRQGPGLWAACAAAEAVPDVEVVAATTGNITIATGLNAGDTVDGVTLVAGDLVLVKSQSTGHQNGVYVVGASPARAGAYDTWAEHVGAVVRVKGGSTYAGFFFFCSSLAGGTLNTTTLTFERMLTGPVLYSSLYPYANLPENVALHDEDTMVYVDHLTGQQRFVTLATLKTYFAS